MLRRSSRWSNSASSARSSRIRMRKLSVIDFKVVSKLQEPATPCFVPARLIYTLPVKPRDARQFAEVKTPIKRLQKAKDKCGFCAFFGSRFWCSLWLITAPSPPQKRRRGPGRGGRFHQFPLSPARSPLFLASRDFPEKFSRIAPLNAERPPHPAFGHALPQWGEGRGEGVHVERVADRWVREKRNVHIA